VVYEAKRGYGSACLAGLAFLRGTPPDIVVFTDADGSDDPGQFIDLILPLCNGPYQMTIASRATGNVEKGSLSFAQRFGNWLATRLIACFWAVRFTDLGPYRAVTWDALERMRMCDTDFGWTVEMQIKAARLGLNVLEIPANYRKRKKGRSKVGGSVQGSLLAGNKILWWIFREKLQDFLINQPELKLTASEKVKRGKT